MNAIDQTRSSSTADSFLIQSEGKGKYIKIKKLQIIYIESLGNYRKDCFGIVDPLLLKNKRLSR